MWSWLVALSLLFVACGPSTQEVKTAKLARYDLAKEKLFDIAIAVAQQDYKIGEAHRPSGQFATEPQMYNADGGRQSPGAGGYIQFSHGSVLLALLVEVIDADGRQVVVVTPKAHQMVVGSPKPRELTPDDPNMPGWAHGRADALAVAIYNAAKQHAVP